MSEKHNKTETRANILKNAKPYSVLAKIGNFFFVPDLDKNGNEIPDMWILPGQPVLMHTTVGIHKIRVFGKGRVVSTRNLKRIALDMKEELIIKKF